MSKLRQLKRRVSRTLKPAESTIYPFVFSDPRLNAFASVLAEYVDALDAVPPAPPQPKDKP